MGILDKFGGGGAGGIASGIAGATPVGAVGNLLASAASTPASSQSGDISSGAKTFGGINVGTQVPAWAWAAGLAFVAIILFANLRRK